MLKIIKKSKKSQARSGVLKTSHGEIKTPFFMPIATKGAVKNLSVADLELLGAQIILSNTYHLYLQPTEKLIKKAGGLHQFIGWHKPILTDSGGYQVFSLSGNKGKGEKLVKLSDEGVEFRSHLDGSKHFFTPEKSIKIQQDLGIDIMMCFDECPSGTAPYDYVEQSIDLTAAWAARCKKQKAKGKKNQQLFGIIQGAIYEDLRLRSLKQITALDFDGYAIGGLAVGEKREDMYRILDLLVPKMPANKPRYLMGVGRPEEIIQAVKCGVDMFDCVIPTREARHGRLYQFKVESAKLKINDFYYTFNIANEKFKTDFSAINPKSKIPLLRQYTKAYLHHLLKTEEGLGFRLATLNNLEFYLDLMEKIRQNIDKI